MLLILIGAAVTSAWGQQWCRQGVACPQVLFTFVTALIALYLAISRTLSFVVDQNNDRTLFELARLA